MNEWMMNDRWWLWMKRLWNEKIMNEKIYRCIYNCIWSQREHFSGQKSDLVKPNPGHQNVAKFDERWWYEQNNFYISIFIYKWMNEWMMNDRWWMTDDEWQMMIMNDYYEWKDYEWKDYEWKDYEWKDI